MNKNDKTSVFISKRKLDFYFIFSMKTLKTIRARGNKKLNKT